MKSKKLFIKLSALLVRGVVLFVGIPSFLIYTLSYIILIRSITSYLYVPELVSWFIIIFPFRLLRSTKSIRAYWYFLDFASFWIIYSSISNLIFGSFKIIPTLPDVSWLITGSIFLLFNIYFVRMYLSHRENSSEMNPFFGSDKLKFLLIPLFLIILFVAYCFTDLTVTPQGRIYFNPILPLEVPKAKPTFDSQALNSRIKISYGGITDSKYPDVYAKWKVKPNDFIELIENNQKILDVVIENEKVKTITVYSSNGAKNDYSINFLSSVNDGGFFGRDTNGNFKLITGVEALHQAIDNPTVYDLLVETGLSSNQFYFSIAKIVSFPAKPKYIPLPFLRKNIPWDLRIKDSEGEVRLVDSIKLFYN